VIWLVILLALALGAFAWVAITVRGAWSRAEDLPRSTAVAISTLYLLASALIAVALLVRPWPIAVSLAVGLSIGIVLVGLGGLLTVAGARPFGSTARLYGVETGGLVEGGVYRFSRNPQYTGLTLLVAGIAAAGRSTVAVALAVVIGAAFWVWVVAVEEPHLREAFGDRYRGYCRRVPRFIGRPRGA
jgi:protein-S-isoprenylcysteine O-methyltransferase Ste14